MARQVESHPDEAGRLRKIDLSLRAEESFPVPVSDGYSVYSSLLSVLDDVDADVSARVHDSVLGSLHCSGLLGRFRGSDRPHHKQIPAGGTYDLSLGVVDPADEAIFQALVSGLVLEGDSVELSHGSLRVESFESTNTTQEELVEQAGEFDDPTIEMQFRTPTCIEEADEVTTMFPHRGSVFNSLLGKWNKTAPEGLAFDVGQETILGSVIEKPDASQYETHSVLVNRVENEDGETRSLFRQGFTGDVAYAFKDASEAVRNAVTSVALFGEYSGVGSAVARGCGNISVEVN
jgi:CRISPR/Cas system endoribonuclease Cas6 (RAMP superfamily)